MRRSLVYIERLIAIETRGSPVADANGRAKTAGNEPILLPEDIIPDAALQQGDEENDSFRHDAIAGRVCELICSAKPPINIALYGPWGSGKSSLYTLLRKKLKDANAKTQVVRYDAWKYGGQSLKRNFISSLAHDMDYDDDEFTERLHGDTEENRLRLGTWLLTNWRALGLGALIAVCVAALWWVLFAYVSMLIQEKAFKYSLAHALPSAGTVLGLTIAALVVGPKMLESASVKISRPAPAADDQFAKSFERLVEKATHNRKRTMVVFIDELDRCSADNVVATLVDLKTFLDQKGCVFVVAADRDVLEEALQEVPQVKPVRESEPYYSTPGAFLDKIFQHQISLPPLRAQALTQFARGLVLDRGGLWAELRDAEPDNRLFDRVTYALVPAHVRSPRRVKVLLNNYATDVRIAEARGIDWLPRAAELAVLTVLKTEFPAVAADLLVFPRLLDAILDPPKDAEPDLARRLQAHVLDYKAPDTDDQAPDTSVEQVAESGPAGPLLMDTPRIEAESAAVREADNRLRRQLRRYLTKARADGIDDPRPDLIYLEGAGEVEGMGDPRLGEVLDFASDTAPAEVVAAFADESSTVRAKAARLLAAQSDLQSGPNRANLIDEACQLFETLDSNDAREVAPTMAASVRVVVTTSSLRTTMIPGAIAVGAYAPNTDLVDGLLSALPDDVIDDEGLLMRVVPILDEVPGDQAGRIEALIGNAYYTDPTPLHYALATLTSAAAIHLWESQQSTITSALEALAEAGGESPPQPPVSTAPTPGRVGVAAPIPPAVEPSPGEDDVERDAPSVRYETLVEAIESRTDVNQLLLTNVLELGQSFGDRRTRQVARQHAESILSLVNDAALRSRVSVAGLLNDEPIEWAWWANQGLHGSLPDDPATIKAAQRLVRELPSVPPSVLDVLPDLFARVLQTTSTTIDPTPIVVELRSVLAATTWEADTAPRRAAAYEIADTLATRVDEADIADLISQDVRNCIENVSLTGDVQAHLLDAVQAMPPYAARSTEIFLSQYSPQDAEAEFILRLRLIALAMYGGAPPPPEVIQAVLLQTTSTPLLDAWLTLRPPVEDVVSVIARGAWPQADAVAKYARTLTPEHRAALWIALDTCDAPPRLLRAAATGGVNADVVAHAQQKLRGQTRQNVRDTTVKRLLNAPFDNRATRVAASDLAEWLLRSEVNGNVPLAAQVVLHAGGAAHGYTERLRGLFDKAVARNDGLLGKEIKTALVAKNLLSKRKSNLEKLFRR